MVTTRRYFIPAKIYKQKMDEELLFGLLDNYILRKIFIQKRLDGSFVNMQNKARCRLGIRAK